MAQALRVRSLLLSVASYYHLHHAVITLHHGLKEDLVAPVFQARRDLLGFLAARVADLHRLLIHEREHSGYLLKLLGNPENGTAGAFGALFMGISMSQINF